MTRHFWIVVLLALAGLSLVFLVQRNKNGQLFSVETTNESIIDTSNRPGVLAKNLEVPWALAFLPNGDLLFTERPGNVKLLKKDSGSPIHVLRIEEVNASGEGGLLGIAISPKFSQNNYIFVYYTYSSNGDDTKNRVVRYRLSGGKLSDRNVIVDAIPGAIFHNGGRIKFGPDGFLYITTGDSLVPSLAQDTNSLAGKILRVDENGKAAFGNPFGNLVYSYGHRNPQGLAWDDRGRLWETEHGQSAQDEVNLIEPGKNYGWPDVRGDVRREGVVSPVIQSGAATWAPSGAAILDGYLYFAGLRGEALFKLSLADPEQPKEVISDLGRIREVAVGPDGFLYIATGNTDGRGQPKADDDKIMRIDPAYLPNF